MFQQDNRSEREAATNRLLIGLTVSHEVRVSGTVIQVDHQLQALFLPAPASVLDPHLTLQDVADRCGYSRTYIAGLVKNELGGFFSYVNRLRLAHADRLKAEKPNIPVGELTEASGFGSYATYYKIRRQLQKADGE